MASPAPDESEPEQGGRFQTKKPAPAAPERAFIRKLFPLLRTLFQNLLGKVVTDLRIVVQHLQIRVLKHLRLAVA